MRARSRRWLVRYRYGILETVTGRWRVPALALAAVVMAAVGGGLGGYLGQTVGGAIGGVTGVVAPFLVDLAVGIADRHRHHPPEPVQVRPQGPGGTAHGGVLPVPTGLVDHPTRGRFRLIERLAALPATPDRRVHVLPGVGGAAATTPPLG